MFGNQRGTGISGNDGSDGTWVVSVHPEGGWESAGLQAGMMITCLVHKAVS